MSKRRMPDLSSRLNATRWPPESSTATVSGARLLSRAFFNATSTMVEACARVTDMLAPVWCEKLLWFAAARPIDRLPRGVAGAKALGVGFFERRQRGLRRWHVGALGGAGGDHGLEVLDGVGDAERGRAGIALFHHGDDHVGAQLEAVVGAVALGKQVDEAFRLPTEVADQRKGLGIGLPADHQRQVNRKLHRRAGADRAAMLDLAAKLVEDRLGARRVDSLGAHQPQ